MAGAPLQNGPSQVPGAVSRPSWPARRNSISTSPMHRITYGIVVDSVKVSVVRDRIVGHRRGTNGGLVGRRDERQRATPGAERSVCRPYPTNRPLDPQRHSHPPPQSPPWIPRELAAGGDTTGA